MMIRRGGTWRRHGRRGAVAVIVALCLIPLIGVTAFAIDGGLLLATKRRAQTVADAAAHAAACRLYANTTTSLDVTGLDLKGNARAAALANASANGFGNDGTTNSVSVNIPPKNGTFANLPFYAEVVVTSNQPRYFSAILGSGTIAVTARGVARGLVGGPKAYSNASMIVLGVSNGASALQVYGAGNLNAESTVQDNSSNATAFRVDNGGIVKASSIQVTGGYSVAGGSTITGPVVTAAPRIPDPLASVPVPDPATLPARTFTSSWQAQTLSPGVYANGITMANGGANTLLPGVYYLKGNGLTIGNGATLTGDGVTIYMDSGAQLTLQGGTSVKLTPPLTGTYAGLTYFQNRSNAKPLAITNGATFVVSGTLYAPASSAAINGGTTNKYGSQLILDTFSLSNGAGVTLPTKTDAAKGYVASSPSSPSITLVE